MLAAPQRIRRYARLFSIASADLARSLDWHFFGARQFYDRHFNTLRKGHKWCFIVGCNNSGTSLLQRILELSNEVSTLPYEGQRYTAVLPRAGRRRYERVWMEYADELRMPNGSQETVGPRLIHDWMRDLPVPIRNIIVEKTPANVLRMQWLQELFPNSCFIGLVRNGYAVAEGIHRKGHKSFRRAARHWNAVNRTMIDESQAVDSFVTMKYEEMTDDPEGAALRLAHFLDLDGRRIVDAMRNDFYFETVNGTSAQGLVNMNSASIARLTPTDKRIILEEAHEMLTYFGYHPA